jgi:multiple sugar transport system substrate-binding protein
MSVRQKRTVVLASAAAVLMALTACGSGNSSGGGGKKTGVTLKVLIGSSGDAETNALNAAGKAWAPRPATRLW